MSLLTPEERHVVDLLTAANEAYAKLLEHSSDDKPMFRKEIVKLQCLVMARPVERELMETGDVEPETAEE